MRAGGHAREGSAAYFAHVVVVLFLFVPLVSVGLGFLLVLLVRVEHVVLAEAVLVGLAALGVQRRLERRQREVVHIAIGALLEALEELFFNGFFEFGGHQRLLLAHGLAPLDLFLDAHQLGLVLLERELAHADEVLRDLGEALLALVLQKLGPVAQLLVDLNARGVSQRGRRMAAHRRTCSSALVYCLDSLTRSHSLAGVCARSAVFMYR